MEVSLSNIQSAMNSEEYKAVKDKFEFKTYKNEFLVSDMVGTNPIFYHMSNLGSYYEDIEFKYSDREIKLFTLTSYNKIDSDMLGNKSAKRLSEHSKLALTRYPYNQTENTYLASIRMDNYEDAVNNIKQYLTSKSHKELTNEYLCSIIKKYSNKKNRY